MKDNISSIIRRAYDLHVHIGPEIIPRKYTVPTLVKNQTEKLAGVALKNHFFPTTPFIASAAQSPFKLFGSIVLNNFVGGLNADAIYATSTLSDTRFIVWFPTVSAKQFLDNSVWEIAPEWVKKKSFQSRRANSVNPIQIFDASGRLSKSSIDVLRAIKETGSILATGHISWQESYALVSRASRMGIKNIIITHPIYQRIAMPIKMQKKLSTQGAKIELCWSMWKIDEIPITDIAAEIKAVGANNCIVSSDSGQAYSPPPSVALTQFCVALAECGITEKELVTMLVVNPKKLLGISKKGGETT